MGKGKTMRLLAVGKIRTPHWREACASYMGKISRWRAIELSEARDSGSELPPAERIEIEGKRLLAKVEPGDLLIPLDGKGEALSSEAFARRIESFDREARRICFAIGGPFGLSQEVLRAGAMRLSLSEMTFPHELARVLLLEQIFRACCILNKFPYHH